MVPYAHTVVVCDVKGRGGTTDKYGALKVVFHSFLKGLTLIDPHSGSVYPQTRGKFLIPMRS